MNGATILVTGGTGAVGRYVVDELQRLGHAIVVFGRSVGRDSFQDHDNIKTFTGSVDSLPDLRAAIKQHRPSRIIHLAAVLSDACKRDPLEGYNTNVIGGINVFVAARDGGVERVVYTSGKGVYGALDGKYGAPDFLPVTEDHVGEPLHIYGSTKKALEDAARHFRQLYGLEIIALRLGSTYGSGKGSQHGGYSGLKAIIVQKALLGEPFEVPEPDIVDDLVYNRDVARGHILAAFAPRPLHWRFNISGGRLVSLRDYTEEVARHVPHSSFSFATRPSSLAASNTRGRLDIGRARRELGYIPEWPGVSGVSEYVQMERVALGIGRPA